jgi:hypothetical protein
LIRKEGNAEEEGRTSYQNTPNKHPARHATFLLAREGQPNGKKRTQRQNALPLQAKKAFKKQ